MASDAKACFSSKVEYRAVIRYLYLKGKTGKEIHGELADVYGSSAPSYAQVKFWVGEFKRGGTSSEDEARSGRPLDATDKEMCKKVWDLVYSDRRISDKFAPKLAGKLGPGYEPDIRTYGHNITAKRCMPHSCQRQAGT